MDGFVINNKKITVTYPLPGMIPQDSFGMDLDDESGINL